ncbi:MAG: phosphotransferase family protein [Parasphingorhabdus sp.]
MGDDDLKDKLNSFCQERFSSDGDIEDLQRLSGGASMESWAFRFGEKDIVLRRLPDGIADNEADAATVSAISLDTQADLIELARSANVTAPEVLAKLKPEDGIGQGFLMVRADGETLPHKILSNPDFEKAVSRLTDQCATELAAIHAIKISTLPKEIQSVDVASLLSLQEQAYRDLNIKIPAYDHAFHWLEENVPKLEDSKLLHADFRMGNLMIDADGISAVLDWELAHLGDPMEDLSYLCTPSWRFGHYEKEAGGFDTAENLIAAYEKASGTIVDRDRFNWWLIYNTLWWGVACLRMGHSYRDGTVHVLERTIIGRRASEVEIDLLLLFEQMAVATGPKLSQERPALLPDDGEVEYAEILNALMEWNKEKVMPSTKGHALFESRVANNALGIVQRHAAWGQIYANRSSERLANIGVSTTQLCAAMRTGERSISEPAIWNHLRLTALERLSIDQPKYAGLRIALNKWSSK